MSITLDDNYRKNVSVMDYDPETLQGRMTILNYDPSQYNENEQEALLHEFIVALEKGDVRAAEQVAGKWEAIAWVKDGILSIFGLAENMKRDGC